jgi:hypothetical protein
MLYYQCSFRRGNEHTVAWIEARGARVGAWVELRGDFGGLWCVETVAPLPMEAKALHDLQRRRL